MKSLSLTELDDYKEDLVSFQKHKSTIKVRLIISSVSIFLAFGCLFMAFVGQVKWAWFLLSLVLLVVFRVCQKLPNIKCVGCANDYKYVLAAARGEDTIYGVCRDCGVKINTKIVTTSG